MIKEDPKLGRGYYPLRGVAQLWTLDKLALGKEEHNGFVAPLMQMRRGCTFLGVEGRAMDHSL